MERIPETDGRPQDGASTAARAGTIPGEAPSPANPARPRVASAAGPSPRACEACRAGGSAAVTGRIQIGAGYARASNARVLLGLPLVYAPILLLPFVALGALLVYAHLRLMGATGLKSLRDFLPAPGSHRYGLKTQVVRRGAHPLAFWARARAFWVFNCTLYCPLSVALLEWTAYLTKAVENWWCPFRHDAKPRYAGSAIDRSYWHATGEAGQLYPEDHDDPTWNADAPRG